MKKLLILSSLMAVFAFAEQNITENIEKTETDIDIECQKSVLSLYSFINIDIDKNQSAEITRMYQDCVSKKKKSIERKEKKREEEQKRLKEIEEYNKQKEQEEQSRLSKLNKLNSNSQAPQTNSSFETQSIDSNDSGEPQ